MMKSADKPRERNAEKRKRLNLERQERRENSLFNISTVFGADTKRCEFCEIILKLIFMQSGLIPRKYLHQTPIQNSTVARTLRTK